MLIAVNLSLLGCSSPELPYYMNGACFPECPQSFYIANKTITVPAEMISDNDTHSKLSMEEIIKVASKTRKADDDDNSTVEIVYQTCLQCWSKCANCTGPSFSECQTCFDGYEMTKDTCYMIQKSFVEDHFLITVTVFICLAAILVFVLVFSLLQFISIGCHRRQGYEMADVEDHSVVNNNGSANGHIPKNGAILKSDLERKNLLEDSESELENEVFVFDKQHPGTDI